MHATNEVIMPVLGMNQDTGKIVKWLVEEGQPIQQGQPLLEVETDKAVVEIEAPVTGVLSNVKAQDGEEIPVGQVIAVLLPPGESSGQSKPHLSKPTEQVSHVVASPLAARIAAENHIDLTLIRPRGKQVEKADVLAYIQAQEMAVSPLQVSTKSASRPLASPKARRLAAENGLNLDAILGSGPTGAVLAVDVLSFIPEAPKQAVPKGVSPTVAPGVEITPGSVWRIMAEHTAAAWNQTPHFFLLREVDATRLMAWREAITEKSETKVTYTDLLVKLAAMALCKHPYVNATYQDKTIRLLPEINIGVAVAVEDGLVVPVIRRANELSVSEIASARSALVDKAHAARLRLEDISDGTFTISNLGMYGVDAFLAIINAPQSAILAVGRIVERVVPANGQVVIRPVMALSLSFDHRSVDGARGAKFLDTLARLIEEPLGLLS